MENVCIAAISMNGFLANIKNFGYFHHDLGVSKVYQ